MSLPTLKNNEPLTTVTVAQAYNIPLETRSPITFKAF